MQKKTALQFYDTLVEQFVKWAEDEPTIRAAVIMGSRARNDRPADEWSDLDICIYGTEMDGFLANTTWVDKFAPVWTKIISRTAGGEPECLVLYEDGYQVDYVFNSFDLLQKAATEKWVPHGFRRGAKVILDKDGVAIHTLPEKFEPPVLPFPGEEEFLSVVNHFWFGIVYLAKQLRRGEMCYFHIRGNALVEPVVKMVEWHARAVNGDSYDTWHMGRFLEHWADANTMNELKKIFSRYDADDGWKALFAGTQLFRRLAIEIAVRRQFNYPVVLDDRVSYWLEKFYQNAVAENLNHPLR